MLLSSLHRWIARRPRKAAIEAEALRIVARHGPQAPIVARALAGAPGRRGDRFGCKVAERVEALTTRRGR